MATPEQVLKYQYMTPLINEILEPPNFLMNSLFMDQEAVHTEDIEIPKVSRDRIVSPFSRKNGEAVLVQSYNGTSEVVQAPNIRIKIPVKPSEMMKRQPGMVIYVSRDQHRSSFQQLIDRNAKILRDDIATAKEYLAAQSLTGQISWSSAEEYFTITYNRPSTHNITLSTFWNDGTLANVRLNANFHTAKRLMSKYGFPLTDVYLGEEAADAFIALVEGGYLKPLDIRNVVGGSVTLVNQFDQSGAMYMGTVAGVNIYEYSRTASVSGTETPMIRSKYAEFVSRVPRAEWKMYYGAILDMDAFEVNTHVAPIFAKGWTVKDPSCLVLLAHSRPVPVPRRPTASVSMKVVSG